MFAQMLVFDGPRDAALVAASDRANLDRIGPAITADPELRQYGVSAYLLRQPDGGEILLALAEDRAAFSRMSEIARGTALLPGEDVALLPGPDRVDAYDVVGAFTLQPS